ncbi:MAG: ribosome-associated translation inhibitor RaiA [Patescibacteria group bacterium]
MKIRILAKNFELTEALNTLVREKLARPIGKLLGELDQKMDLSLDVELAKLTKHHQHGRIWYCEVNLSLPSSASPIRAKSSELSLPAAIDEVKYEIENEIKKYKSKRKSTAIREARRAKVSRRS